MRRFDEPSRSRARSGLAAAALLAAGVAGCSTDISPFNEGPVRPRPQSGAPGIGSYQPQPQYSAPRQDYTGSIPQQPQGAPNNWSWDGGTAVTVAQGDTLESISKRHGVPVHAIYR